MTATERAALEAELGKAQAEIDAAYWRFTRCARATTSTGGLPEAYARRKTLEALLGKPPGYG